MSTMGIAPGMQGGIPGEGKIWSPWKRIISQQEKEEKTKKEKLLSNSSKRANEEKR